MIEVQRRKIERDVAAARAAIHRALETAEGGAYYGIEDALHLINADLAAVMDCVMRGRERVELPERVA